MSGAPSVRVTAVTLRDFRNYERAELALGERLTVVTGPNGAGKTNLLEAIYFGCTARSPRTSTERDLIRHGQHVARVTVTSEDGAGGSHLIEVGFAPGEQRSMRVDGAAVDNLSSARERPLVSVFMPERLELVKGGPSLRRAHLDHLIAALWPGRAVTRAAYGRALSQRNALLARIRAGTASSSSLGSWDLELARNGAELMCDRQAVVELVAPLFARRAGELGLPEEGELSYRPRSRSRDAAGLAAELRERRDADLERGFTAHGPHRDDLYLVHGGRPLRTFGSQGQQRIALLALLFAERDVLAAERGGVPLMLLDDVMSELDPERRALLAELLRSEGQGMVTTADLGQVPGTGEDDVVVVEVAAGALTTAAAAAGRR